MRFTAVAPLLTLVSVIFSPEVSSRAADDGKYSKRKYFSSNNGKYVHKNEGDYVEDLDRYRYVHYDDGDRGRYIHVHIPYDGGYGNYAGGHEPFRNPPYDATGLYAYVQRPKNDTCLRLLEQYSNTCSDNIIDSPFRANEYDIKKPELYLEYGTPYPEFNYGASVHREKQTPITTDSDPRASNFPGTGYLPALETPVVKKATSTEHPEADSLGELGISTVTTTTTTTTSGRDERIIRLATEAPVTKTTTGSTTIKSSTTEAAATVSASSTLATLSTVKPASIEQQLLECRAELNEAKRKLSLSKLVILGCAFAQQKQVPNFNDGRYYPELYQGKYDDGKYHPDSSGAYRPDGSGKYSGKYVPYVHGKYGEGGQGGAGGAGSGIGGQGGRGGAGGAGSSGSGSGGAGRIGSGLSGAGKIGSGSSGAGKIGSGSSGAGTIGSGSSGAGKIGSGAGQHGVRGSNSGAGSGLNEQSVRVSSGAAGSGLTGQTVLVSSSGTGSAGFGSRIGSGSGAGSSGAGRVTVPNSLPVVPPKLPTQKAKKPDGFGSSSGSGFDRIKEQVKEYNQDGYYYRYLTEQDAQVAETGRLEDRDSDNEVLRAKGFYEYVGDDGVRYRVDYNADENGFVPQGVHLPTPPPIPDEIARALEYVRNLQQ
ncbi:uncharacterized protein LOC131429221 [Malaya genurostris]|uniref:uncharacterized protein LOC131429221 n=1 Tax=Malaya genurostris TaxID=325434 RepID=UPI0026F3BB04|nr:uncharacterized protein LOC131429221 [Malaya genurostris]